MTRRREDGFTLVELALATAISLTVMASVLAIAMPAQEAFAVQPEAADLQQRVRVAVDTLAKDLRTAGTRMPVTTEALQVTLAPVVPYRIGEVGSDPAAGRYYRGGVISVLQLAAPVAGSTMPQRISRTYYVRASPDVSQLMQYNGQQGDFPVLDDVVSLAFEYFGEASPPQLILPTTEEARPRVSYGPRPPSVGVDDAGDTWGPGENCTWMVVDGTHRSRLPALAGQTAQVRLQEEVLTDGPWCPDAGAPDRFDADLLRIRRVGVQIRVQAQRSFRGPQGVLFARGGTAPARRYVPDMVVRLDVAPRNLSLGQ